jgi:hypothetical protein
MPMELSWIRFEPERYSLSKQHLLKESNVADFQGLIVFGTFLSYAPYFKT